MKLAIENLSPISGGAILLNNINVVLRATVIMSSLLAFLYLMLNADKLEIPIWFIFSLVAASALANWGLSRAVLNGVLMRRLRYQGSIAWMRFAKEEVPEGIERPWTTDLPRWPLRRKKFDEFIAKTIEDELEKVSEDEIYVSFVVGQNETGDYALKRLHSCSGPDACNKPEIHLFGYDEKRDGAVWWGL